MAELFKYRADARISDCGKYRYWLSRVWDEAMPVVCWIMLNPSTADAIEDDPTIRRCVRFAQIWGAGGIYVVNLFAYRATDPADLATVADPVGPENESFIKCNSGADGDYPKRLHVVAAWGANGGLLGRERQVVAMLADKVHLKCLDVTKHGHPRHPLYVHYGQELIDYPPKEVKG